MKLLYFILQVSLGREPIIFKDNGGPFLDTPLGNSTQSVSPSGRDPRLQCCSTAHKQLISAWFRQILTRKHKGAQPPWLELMCSILCRLWDERGNHNNAAEFYDLMTLHCLIYQSAFSSRHRWSLGATLATSVLTISTRHEVSAVCGQPFYRERRHGCGLGPSLWTRDLMESLPFEMAANGRARFAESCRNRYGKYALLCELKGDERRPWWRLSQRDLKLDVVTCSFSRWAGPWQVKHKAYWLLSGIRKNSNIAKGYHSEKAGPSCFPFFQFEPCSGAVQPAPSHQSNQLGAGSTCARTRCESPRASTPWEKEPRWPLLIEPHPLAS